jgi:hypothetical protein
MYTRSFNKAAVTKKYTLLVCGKQYHGSVQQVSKLIQMHSKRCTQCSSSKKITSTIIKAKKGNWADGSYLWNILNTSQGKSTSDVYKETFDVYVMLDFKKNPNEWASMESAQTRLDSLVIKFEPIFAALVRR